MRTSRGFTLVELMVVIMITAILASIAIPGYQAQIRKSRRTEAKTALLDLAGREERYLATQGGYTNALDQLAWTGTATASNYYNIAAPTITAAAAGNGATTAATPATFLLTATTNGTQTKDTTCAKFTVDQAGNQLSYDSGGAISTGCW